MSWELRVCSAVGEKEQEWGQSWWKEILWMRCDWSTGWPWGSLLLFNRQPGRCTWLLAASVAFWSFHKLKRVWDWGNEEALLYFAHWILVANPFFRFFFETVGFADLIWPLWQVRQPARLKWRCSWCKPYQILNLLFSPYFYQGKWYVWKNHSFCWSAVLL